MPGNRATRQLRFVFIQRTSLEFRDLATVRAHKMMMVLVLEVTLIFHERLIRLGFQFE
jgi:hypothetical protein